MWHAVDRNGERSFSIDIARDIAIQPVLLIVRTRHIFTVRQTPVVSATPLPLATPGSLSPTSVPARPVRLAVKLPYTFTLCARFPTVLTEPLGASVTFWEATAPVKLPT